MSTNLSTPVLLRRIARLEATVGRLSEDLGALRSAFSKQGLQLPSTRGLRSRVAHADSIVTGTPHDQATGGLAGATARGEAARVTRVKVPEAAEARSRTGLSQEQFARLLGVSARTLQDWEQGRREPTGAAKTLLRVAYEHPEVLLKLER